MVTPPRTEVDVLAELNALSSRLWRIRDLHDGLEAVLDATIALLGADKGNVRLLDEPRRVLSIAAQRGFDPTFLEQLGELSVDDDCACGRASRTGARITVEDVELDRGYAPYRSIARASGFRAVQSTPLISRHGRLLGVLSTHFPDPHQLSEADTTRLDLYARKTTDFIERVRTDDALRKSEERFARFMHYLPGLAWIKDSQGRYVFANEAAARAFQTSRAELIGRTDAEVFPPEIAAQFSEHDRIALENGTGVQVIETLEHDDGVLHKSIVHKFPMPGADGAAPYVGGMAIDVTERMRAEEELREADRRKDQFLATLAHELRNPLAPLRNGLELMKLARDDAQAIERAREMMERQLAQMVRLIDDLLDVSRISRGRITLRNERLNLVDVLRHSIEAVRPTIERAGHSLTITLPSEEMWLDGDETRLAQVFANLLGNAAKFTDPGGHVWITAARDGDAATINVRDSGIGIPAPLLGTVFEMFAQVDAAQERAQGGLGIGLSLVKGLVEMHGGTVAAHSEGPGRGSEFVVRLPLAEERRVEADTGEQRLAQTSGRRRILVVDDNHDAATSLAMLLDVMDNETRVANDGTKALETVHAFKPHVVLLDLGMPMPNGYEVARRIRAMPGGEAIALVAVTGWGQEEIRRGSLEAGFDFHLVKPAEPAAIRGILSNLEVRPEAR